MLQKAITIKFHKGPFHSFLIFESTAQIMELRRCYTTRKRIIILQTCFCWGRWIGEMFDKFSIILEETENQSRAQNENPRASEACQKSDQVNIHTQKLNQQKYLVANNFCYHSIPGIFLTPYMLHGFFTDTKLCYLPCIQCGEQRRKQDEISVPVR